MLLLVGKTARDVDGAFRVMAQIMAQTSLGEIIEPLQTGSAKADQDLALRSINSKRLDFAVFHRFGHLIMAVEYQGSGHCHATSFMRDAVKKEALREAGVAFLEVSNDYDVSHVQMQIKNSLLKHATDHSYPL